MSKTDCQKNYKTQKLSNLISTSNILRTAVSFHLTVISQFCFYIKYEPILY